MWPLGALMAWLQRLQPSAVFKSFALETWSRATSRQVMESELVAAASTRRRKQWRGGAGRQPTRTQLALAPPSEQRFLFLVEGRQAAIVSVSRV